MITLDKAQRIAHSHLQIKHSSRDKHVAIQEELTVETADGFVFFYNSVRFIETGDEQYKLISDPIIVTKLDGVLRALGYRDVMALQLVAPPKSEKTRKQVG